MIIEISSRQRKCTDCGTEGHYSIMHNHTCEVKEEKKEVKKEVKPKTKKK